VQLHFGRYSSAPGNLQGKKIDGGNPFEAPRQRNYPLPPLCVRF
jgi:gluconate 2-dehydrogenase alpha chain